MPEIIELRETFDATAQEIYCAWLSSQLHTKMTGGQANWSDKIGANLTVIPRLVRRTILLTGSPT